MINCYTDGGCINNGKPVAIAGIGCYFPNSKYNKISERYIGKQTNNAAELYAIIKACDVLQNEIKNNVEVNIYTDSKYSILCATTYGEKLAKKNFIRKKPIPNVELVKKIYFLFTNNDNLHLLHVKAHTGKQDEHSIGNDIADTLANTACVK